MIHGTAVGTPDAARHGPTPGEANVEPPHQQYEVLPSHIYFLILLVHGGPCAYAAWHAALEPTRTARYASGLLASLSVFEAHPTTIRCHLPTSLRVVAPTPKLAITAPSAACTCSTTRAERLAASTRAYPPRPRPSTATPFFPFAGA